MWRIPRSEGFQTRTIRFGTGISSGNLVLARLRTAPRGRFRTSKHDRRTPCLLGGAKSMRIGFALTWHRLTDKVFCGRALMFGTSLGGQFEALQERGCPMKFLFRNESFSFETLRTAGFATYGGADLGEVLATARLIPNGNEEAWLKSWSATADRAANIAETSLRQGHHVSAREAFFRASNYYRTAEFFRRRAPANDPDVIRLSDRSRQTFVAAAKLLGSPCEIIRIPYENTTLPGYMFRVDNSGTPRPTVIYNNGFDSTQEESYVAIGAAALRRGYNVLTLDGPGQGAAIRHQKLVFRPDWEAVLSPVIDYANTRPEIDSKRLILFGDRE